MSSKLIVIVPDRLKSELDVIVKAEEQSLSEMVRELLKDHVAKWKLYNGGEDGLPNEPEEKPGRGPKMLTLAAFKKDYERIKAKKAARKNKTIITIPKLTKREKAALAERMEEASKHPVY